jgi:acyl-CoA synthetase (AMP-forming)/AMP-acid ligase II
MTDVRFPDEFNLADYWLFAREREGRGDHPAIRFGDRTWTYAEVADRARALARGLIARGLRPEERVYIVLPDVPPFAWAIFATLAAGGVVTMGNPAVPPADLAAVIDYVKAAIVVTTPAVADGPDPAPDRGAARRLRPGPRRRHRRRSRGRGAGRAGRARQRSTGGGDDRRDRARPRRRPSAAPDPPR